MKVKIVGIGKCGIRIAYDLFAYTRGVPSAYEIRLEISESRPIARRSARYCPGNLKKKLDPLRAWLKQLANDFNALYRIAEAPEYVTIDSDSANNEIVNRVIIATRGSDGAKETHLFPGTNHDLNKHEGGCNFHVVSEYLAREWTDVPSNITACDGISIFVTSFSIAGGTGGGSAPIICSRARVKISEKQSQCHFMGLGVLPKSDERYSDKETALTMSDYENLARVDFLPHSMVAGWPMG